MEEKKELLKEAVEKGKEVIKDVDKKAPEVKSLYKKLQDLENKGYQFESETDTEVLVQLISDIYYSDGLEFSQAVQIALNEVVGAYGIVTFCNDEPN